MAAKSLPLSVAIATIASAPFVRGVTGREHLPADNRYIVAANHSSVLDGVVLACRWAWLRFMPLHMIAYEEPFRSPVWGWFLRSSGCIAFARGRVESRVEMLRTALGFLDAGEPVGIFPEAHIGKTSRLRPPRPGVAVLALESGAPIVPVGIRGSREVLPLGAKKPRLRRAIEIRIGPPLPISEEAEFYRSADRHGRAEAVRAVLGRIMPAIAELSGLSWVAPRRRRGETQ